MFRAVLVILMAILGYVLFLAVQMKLKNGASLDGVGWRMFYASIISESIFKKFGASELVITSGTDGNHMLNSKHYSGEALDFRTWEISDVTGLAAALRTKLGSGYDVVVESDHLHVEYDPKVTT